MEEMIGRARVPEEVVSGRVVLGGFEPFEGRPRNRSWELVRRFRGKKGMDVFRLPVDFSQLKDVIGGILGRRPRAFLMVGESPTNELRVEQVALNVADTDSPDNAGRLPQDEPLIAAGPLGLRTSWNARQVAGRLHQEGIPATVSFHAGTFACNAALYHCLAAAAEPEEWSTVREESDRAEGTASTAIGFFHVPNSRGPSGLGTTNLVRAVEIGVEELLAVAPE